MAAMKRAQGEAVACGNAGQQVMVAVAGHPVAVAILRV
jgi:hypothetical protein